MPDALIQAKSTLLTPYGIDQALIDQTLLNASCSGIQYADLYFQYTCFESWLLEDGLVKNGAFNIDQGFGIRTVVVEKAALAHANQITPHALDVGAKSVKSIGQEGVFPLQNLPQENIIQPRYLAKNPISSLSATSKVALLQKIDRIARQQDSKVTQVIAQLAAKHEVIYIARHDGFHAADIRPLIRLSVYVIAEDKGFREEGSAGGGGRFDLTFFTDDTLERYAKLATERALIKLQAKPAPAGQMVVVLGPGWPGILLHEAVGHGLEADFHRKGTSAFTHLMGQQVAAKGISIVDNGTLPNKRGSLTIDDEATPTQNTMLIENGILKNMMQDTLNARLMKASSTGNGRRESYAALPMPRMTNTYMLGGDYEPSEIIASVKKGIYAANFSGGEVDITNGQFVFCASEAWQIENGRLSYPIKGATLIGNGPEVLHYVSMVGNDLALDEGLGTCGKNGQSVAVGIGQPTLRIDEGLTVGGVSL